MTTSTNVERLWLRDGALFNRADEKVIDYTPALLHKGHGTTPPSGAFVKLGNSRYPTFFRVL